MSKKNKYLTPAEKLAEAQRLRGKAVTVLAERDALKAALNVRGQRRDAGAGAPFVPVAATDQLNREQLAAFEAEAADLEWRAAELEREVEDRPREVAEFNAAVAQRRTDDVRFIRMKVQDVLANARYNAAKVVVDGGSDSPDGFSRFMRSTRGAVDASQLDRELARMEREARKRATASVVKEPRVYGKDSPNSYFADIAATRGQQLIGDPGLEAAAQQRLARYEAELAFEARKGSKEGKRAERIIRASVRSEDRIVHERIAGQRVAELRALGTGGGGTAAAGSGAAAFVSPAFLLTEWAPFRGVQRAFADQCRQARLPKYGMQVYLPAFSTTDSVTQQTEATAVSEIDPGAQLQGSGQVQTVAGEITITQQLADRGFTGDGAFDVVIHEQLQQQLDQQVDVYTLNTVLAGGGFVTGAGAYTTGNLYQDLAKAREVLTDTAGTRLRPTHLFTTSDLYSYATRQVDSSNRPILQPQFAPGFPIVSGADDNANRPKWARFTGTILPGGVLWFTDDNIPQSGTTGQTQLVVSAPGDAVLLLEDDPVFAILPQTAANLLEVVLILREYVAVITRHAQGTASIAGGAYPASAV